MEERYDLVSRAGDTLVLQAPRGHLPKSFGAGFSFDAVSAVQAALAFVKENDVTKWREKVGSKLDLLLDRLEDVVVLIQESTRAIIESDNKNWKIYFDGNIKGLGKGWELYSRNPKLIGEAELKSISSGFDQLRIALAVITARESSNHWGYSMVECVRAAFTYAVLAHKLHPAEVSLGRLQVEVAHPVLCYLRRSMDTTPSEPTSLPHSLQAIRTKLVGHLAEMENWCNTWVRISRARDRITRTPRDWNISLARDSAAAHLWGAQGAETKIEALLPAQRSLDPLYGDVYSEVLIARITGGARAPRISETKLSREERDLALPAYPGFPGNIDANEGVKAREYCQYAIDSAVRVRDDLATKETAVSQLVEAVKADVERLEQFLSGIELAPC